MYSKQRDKGFTPTPIHAQSSGDVAIIEADRLFISQNIKSSRDVGVKPTERVLVSGFTPTLTFMQSLRMRNIFTLLWNKCSTYTQRSRRRGLLPQHKSWCRGFTILELLVVILIIGVLAAIIMVSIDVSRKKGRDANRASQTQEFLKAAEIYYSDTGGYPNDGSPPSNKDPVPINQSIGFLRADGGFLSRIPPDPIFDAANGYLYCATNGGDSMTILVHAESDNGDYCLVTRGASSLTTYCTNLPANSGSCIGRF